MKFPALSVARTVNFPAPTLPVSTFDEPAQLATPEPVPSEQEKADRTAWPWVKCSPSVGAVMVMTGAAVSLSSTVIDWT